MAGKPKTAEMHAGPGFRVRHRIDRPPSDVVAGLGEFDTPSISDLMNRLYALDPAIHNLTDESLDVAGPACTVKVYPGDNLMVHKALDIAMPGDLVVVDAGGHPPTAVLGDLISTKARHRGIQGFIVDGPIRDLPAIRALGDFPVYARGVTPRGPLHRGPGEINYPISAGGVVVHPGDVIVADMSGIVCVPQTIAAEILDRLRARAAQEAEYNASVARGDFSNAWVDQVLADGAVAIEDPVDGPH